MTRGAVIFAYNNDAVDYVAMAAWSAQRVQQWLDLPVTLITDSEVDHAVFDQVIRTDRVAGNSRYYQDYNDSFAWYNMDRCDALDLSPYDRTLVIDADYVVNGPDLMSLMHDGPDFVCHRYAFDVAQQQHLNPTFGDHGMPQWWATVMMFGRTSATRYIFDTMRMVRENWVHYCDIYRVHRCTFRNDYALSIALGLISGHSLVTQDIPWSLISITPEQQLEQLELDLWRVTFTEKGRLQYMMLRGLDFHAMGKRTLGESIARNS
jgi:hypothetical protein